MDDGFIAKPLGKRQIDQAFPLVRAMAPELPVERWRAFAAALCGPDDGDVGARGIITVQNDRGYIHGLFSYSTVDDLRHGRVVAVENFIVLDLFDPASAAAVLIKAMETVAQTLSCAAIVTDLPECYGTSPEYRGSLLTVFRGAGHVVEALHLRKAVGATGDAPSRTLADAHDAA